MLRKEPNASHKTIHHKQLYTNHSVDNITKQLKKIRTENKNGGSNQGIEPRKMQCNASLLVGKLSVQAFDVQICTRTQKS